MQREEFKTTVSHIEKALGLFLPFTWTLGCSVANSIKLLLAHLSSAENLSLTIRIDTNSLAKYIGKLEKCSYFSHLLKDVHLRTPDAEIEEPSMLSNNSLFFSCKINCSQNNATKWSLL